MSTIVLVAAVIAAITGLLALAKHKRGRGRGRFQTIPIKAEVALSTLADAAFVTVSVTGAFTSDCWLISSDVTVSIAGSTAGEVPITCGVAHSDLSSAEVGENLDVAITGPDLDVISRERSRRPVRRLATFTDQEQRSVLRRKLSFMLPATRGLTLWVRNESGAPLTTGAIVSLTGLLYLSWR